MVKAENNIKFWVSISVLNRRIREFLITGQGTFTTLNSAPKMV